MPQIIAFAHQKGGVGKTTLLLNLYGFLASQAKCAVLDTDPQGSIATLYNQFKDSEDSSWSELEIIDNKWFEQTKKYDALRQIDAYDYILIDTPPYLSDRTTPIFKAVDLVIIPTRVSTLDVAAIVSTVNMVKEAQKQAPRLKAGIVLNAVKTSTKFVQNIRNMIGSYYDLQLLDTAISDRVDYARTLLASPYLEPETNETAAKEMAAFGKEILELLKTKKIDHNE